MKNPKRLKVFAGLLLTTMVVVGVITPTISSRAATPIIISNYVDLSDQNLTDQELADLLSTGAIPSDTMHLDLSSNPITNDALTLIGNHFYELRFLDVSHCQISGTMEFPINGTLSYLTELIATDNQIDQVGRLPAFTEIVNVSNNAIDALDGLMGVQQIHIQNNLIESDDLQYLTGGIGLLDVSGNMIDDLSYMSHVYGLHTLDISDNPVGNNITTLGAGRLNYLKSLWAENCGITDASPIGSLSSLSVLSLDSNMISNIGFVNNLRLSSLSICDNLLDDSSFANVTINPDVLLSVDFCGNSLTESSLVKLAGLPWLSSICVSRNQISDISSLMAVDCTRIHFIGLSNNLLDSDDLYVLEHIINNKGIYNNPYIWFHNNPASSDISEMTRIKATHPEHFLFCENCGPDACAGYMHNVDYQWNKPEGRPTIFWPIPWP